MRRAPVVIGATVVGLIGVLGFHTKSAPVNLGSLSGASTTQGSTTTTTTGSSAGNNSSGASSPPSPVRTRAPQRSLRRIRRHPAPRPPEPPLALQLTTTTGYCQSQSRLRANGLRKSVSGPSTTVGTFAPSPSTSSRSQSSSSRPSRLRTPTFKACRCQLHERRI